MGIAHWFKKDEVTGCKVLVCALANRFDLLVGSDGDIYRRLYPSTDKALFQTTSGLVGAIAREHYDIVHLFCDVSPSGAVSNSENDEITGTELIAQCCNSGVKLLWIASDNMPERYVQNFTARGKRINLVMTIIRNDPKFSEFLHELLSRMSCGETMPVAWANLCPQIPGAQHPDAPACIFWAGRGGVKLLR